MAVSASDDDSAQSGAIGPIDERFVVANRAGARSVARTAGGDKILWAIVERIGVQMISHQRIGGLASLTDGPVDRFSAPVAWMQSTADLVEQRGAGTGKQTGPACKRVSGSIYVPANGRPVLRPRLVGADFGAVRANPRRRTAVGSAAVCAGIFHADHISTGVI